MGITIDKVLIIVNLININEIRLLSTSQMMIDDL